MVGAYILAGEIGRHCGRGDIGKDGGNQAKNLPAAMKTYEKSFRPLADYFQEDVIKGKTPNFPTTWLGINVMYWALAVSAFFGFDIFGRSTIRQPLQSWELPLYEELPDYGGK